MAGRNSNSTLEKSWFGKWGLEYVSYDATRKILCNDEFCSFLNILRTRYFSSQDIYMYIFIYLFTGEEERDISHDERKGNYTRMLFISNNFPRFIRFEKIEI